MKLEKEILKENGLTNIDELIDSQFGKPGTPLVVFITIEQPKLIRNIRV